jgi:hypothetical protein
MPDTEENRKNFVSTIPIGRPSTPGDVANACCYLASDEAAFITGVNLEVSTTETRYKINVEILLLTMVTFRSTEVAVYEGSDL